MRKKELVMEVITETLESINEENEIIRSHKTPIPQIELDMILENIRKLYANYRLLDKFNLEETETFGAFQPLDKPITIGFEKKKEAEPESAPALSEPVAESIPSAAEFKPDVPSAPDETKITDETAVAVETKVTDEAEALSDTVDHTQKVADYTFDLFSAQPATIADKYRNEEKTIHEQISSQGARENIASRIQQTPITELKSVIGLNDKFIFINELFHGNMKAYQETIHSLDQLTTLNDAIRYFTEVKDTFDMNEELESFRKLAEMIQRKFRGVDK
jgi:hypothetical protein